LLRRRVLGEHALAAVVCVCGLGFSCGPPTLAPRPCPPRSGFRNSQPNGCEVPRSSCLNNQAYDVYQADVARVAAGEPCPPSPTPYPP
jgi:hypothetical protein